MKDIADPVHGVINLRKLGPHEFSEAVAMSKAMIGVGNPWWSPSPYHALCMGVPFLNPVSANAFRSDVNLLTLLGNTLGHE